MAVDGRPPKENAQAAANRPREHTESRTLLDVDRGRRALICRQLRREPPPRALQQRHAAGAAPDIHSTRQVHHEAAARVEAAPVGARCTRAQRGRARHEVQRRLGRVRRDAVQPRARRRPRAALLPLQQLAGEADVGRGDAAQRPDCLVDLVVGLAQLPHQVGDRERGAAADALGAVDEHAAAAAAACSAAAAAVRAAAAAAATAAAAAAICAGAAAWQHLFGAA